MAGNPNYNSNNAAKRRKLYDDGENSKNESRKLMTLRSLNYSYFNALFDSSKGFNFFADDRRLFDYTPIDDKHDLSSTNYHFQLKIVESFLQDNEYDLKNEREIQESHFNDIQRGICLIVSKIIYEKKVTRVSLFTIDEFAFRQTQCFSEHFFRKKEMKTASHPIDKVLKTDKPKPSVVQKEKLYKEELFTECRRILGYMALLSKKYKLLSEMILTRNHLTCENVEGTHTVISLICTILNSHVIEFMYIYENIGLTLSLTELLIGLTSHYGEYESLEAIDENLEIFFKNVLALASYDMDIMVNLSESFLNIAKFPKRINLLKKMCTSFPISNQSYSDRYHLYQIDRCECQYPIFFMLLNNVIPYYETPNANQIDKLMKLTFNVNSLVTIFFGYDLEMQFLMPQKDSKRCACFRELVHSILLLNTLVLKYKNADSYCFYQIEATAKSLMFVINNLLHYARESVISKDKFFSNTLNEIYTFLKYDNVIVKDSFRQETKVINLSDYLTKKDISIENLQDNILNKFKPRYMEEDDDLPTDAMMKEDLWNELIEGFKKDQTFGFDKLNLNDV